MRGLRSFLGLLIVLIALGGYLYFVDSKRTPGGDDEKREKVFAVEADAIDEISIKSEAGERTTVRKSGTAWQIVAPVTGQPDEAEISGLTSNLASLEIQRVVEENAENLEEFGLADPRIEVAFKANGQQHRLQIGQKSPTGTNLYARLNDEKKVILISSYLDSTFNRSTFDLRDKSVLKVDRDKVDALEIGTGTRAVRFTKADGEWRLTAPAGARADFSGVESLVGRLSSAQMKSIAAAEIPDLEKYGLDKPAATIRLGTGSAQASLALGGAADEGTVYARDLSRPLVFTVESSLLDELKKDPGEFREKDLFDARSFNATRIELTRGGQVAAFEKQKAKNKEGQEEEKWRQVLPSERDVDSAKVDSLVSSVTAVRADSFVESTAKTGLDTPDLSVLIKFDEGRKEDRVAFGRSGSDAYASRSGEPGAAKIAAATLDAIVKSLEELK
jgi:hypothetical protein